MTDRLTPANERDIDTALIAMSKVRDRLVHQGENIAAVRVDEAMEKLELACAILTRAGFETECV